MWERDRKGTKCLVFRFQRTSTKVWIAGLAIETSAWYKQAASTLYLPVHTSNPETRNWWLWMLISVHFVNYELKYHKSVSNGFRAFSHSMQTLIGNFNTGKMLKIFPTWLLEEVHHRITVDYGCMVRNHTTAVFRCFNLSCLSLTNFFPLSQTQSQDASRCRAIYPNVLIFGLHSIPASQL